MTPISTVSVRGSVGHSIERSYCLQEGGSLSLGDRGEEHLWNCTRQLLGCSEEESKVGVRGDKDSLIQKNKRIRGYSDSVGCKQAVGEYSCLAMPCT